MQVHAWGLLPLLCAGPLCLAALHAPLARCYTLCALACAALGCWAASGPQQGVWAHASDLSFGLALHSPGGQAQALGSPQLHQGLQLAYALLCLGTLCWCVLRRPHCSAVAAPARGSRRAPAAAGVAETATSAPRPYAPAAQNTAAGCGATDAAETASAAAGANNGTDTDGAALPAAGTPDHGSATAVVPSSCSAHQLPAGGRGLGELAVWHSASGIQPLQPPQQQLVLQQAATAAGEPVAAAHVPHASGSHERAAEVVLRAQQRLYPTPLQAAGAQGQGQGQPGAGAGPAAAVGDAMAPACVQAQAQPLCLVHKVLCGGSAGTVPASGAAGPAGPGPGLGQPHLVGGQPHNGTPPPQQQEQQRLAGSASVPAACARTTDRPASGRHAGSTATPPVGTPPPPAAPGVPTATPAPQPHAPPATSLHNAPPAPASHPTALSPAAIAVARHRARCMVASASSSPYLGTQDAQVQHQRVVIQLPGLQLSDLQPGWEAALAQHMQQGLTLLGGAQQPQQLLVLGLAVRQQGSGGGRRPGALGGGPSA